MKLRSVIWVIVVCLLAGLAACDSAASYDERMAYLRKTAQRGAETHGLLASQEATIDRPRCERAFEGVVTSDAPSVEQWENKAWQAQIKEFFVDSCVSGKPKPVPGDQATTSPSSTTTSTPSPSAPLPSRPR